MLRRESDLRDILRRIDGRGFKAYQDVEGEYQFGRFVVAVDHAQGDPFASPSLARVRVAQKLAGFPSDLYWTSIRRIALQDFVTRVFAQTIRRVVKGNRGSGHSGLIAVDAGGKEILERTSCLFTEAFAEVRFAMGLPAYGRTCQGQEAAAMFFQEVPRLAEAALFYAALDAAALRRHVAVAEDQEALRAQLRPRGVVAFVADGSVLPRASGVSEEPMRGENVVRFASPPELRLELDTPNQGRVAGMGIPKGVTVICGGGFHGKSTLLRALDRGVYNHVPGDGREYVVSRGDAVKIRAEDGRSVERVDISPFISNLPFQKDTRAFSTENASGSTSQAANIVEALECGASLLLIDEDTSATNFMIRDARMQKLVAKANEPITPFIDQVRNLHRQHGVSTTLVIGGSGDYFEVSDTVIRLINYLPSVATEEAHRIAREMPTHRVQEAQQTFGSIVGRAVLPDSLDPYRRGRMKVSARGLRAIEFGEETIDLQYVEQLVDPSQTRAIADMLVYGLRQGYFEGEVTLVGALRRCLADVSARGLDVISPRAGQHPGDYALPRLQEMAAAINRLRGLRVRQTK
ncbi:MAG: ABC-ATPase domain-containing protein [Chloroflexi bacterium]|nr:ABC-ATPase domain-containing protein [Chloroflexota bacterium]